MDNNNLHPRHTTSIDLPLKTRSSDENINDIPLHMLNLQSSSNNHSLREINNGRIVYQPNGNIRINLRHSKDDDEYIDNFDPIQQHIDNALNIQRRI